MSTLDFVITNSVTVLSLRTLEVGTGKLPMQRSTLSASSLSFDRQDASGAKTWVVFISSSKLTRATVDYGPILKYLEASDLAHLNENETIDTISNDLMYRRPDFWDRMRRHYSFDTRYIPRQISSLTEFIAEMYDSIFLRQCSHAPTPFSPYNCPFGPFDTIYILHLTATWNDFLMQQPLNRHHLNVSFYLSRLGVRFWAQCQNYGFPKYECIDRNHLKIGKVILLKHCSKVLDVFVVYNRAKHCWKGHTDSVIIQQNENLGFFQAFEKLKLSKADEEISQRYPMVIIGRNKQMF